MKEKAFHLWMENNKEHVPIDVSMLLIRNHRVYMNISVRNPVKQVAPRHLLQLMDGYTDSRIGLTEKCKNY